MLEVLPSLPVPEMTIARGAGPFWAESQTRNRRLNQNTLGTGRAQGNLRLISVRGTFSGRVGLLCGGVPKTVARKAAESARPVGGSAATAICDWVIASLTAAFATAVMKSAARSSPT